VSTLLLLTGIVMLWCVESREAVLRVPHTERAEVGVVRVTENIIKPYSTVNIETFHSTPLNDRFVFLISDQTAEIPSKEQPLPGINMTTYQNLIGSKSEVEIIWQRNGQFSHPRSEAEAMSGGMPRIKQRQLDFSEIWCSAILRDETGIDEGNVWPHLHFRKIALPIAKFSDDLCIFGGGCCCAIQGISYALHSRSASPSFSDGVFQVGSVGFRRFPKFGSSTPQCIGKCGHKDSRNGGNRACMVVEELTKSDPEIGNRHLVSGLMFIIGAVVTIIFAAWSLIKDLKD
jgi:hypothetical protein